MKKVLYSLYTLGGHKNGIMRTDELSTLTDKQRRKYAADVVYVK
jgi:hypothetical protein